MRKIILGTIFAIGMAMSTSAITVVDLTVPTPTDTSSSRAADISTSTNAIWNFSQTTALISGSTNAGASNTRVYGGVMAACTPGFGTGSPFLKELALGVQTSLYVSATPSAAGTSMIKALICWNKSDFLAGADAVSAKVGLKDTGNLLAINFSGITATTIDMRFAVNQGGTWYVTDTNKNTSTIGAYTLDPSAQTWRTISTDGKYTIGSTVTSLVLDDVQAVGYYASLQRSGGSTAASCQTILGVNDFLVGATIRVATSAKLSLFMISSGN